jgi:uroporphyrinogen decarboxylase
MSDTAAPPAAQSAFLKAARGEAVPHTPVWFMRQAGRSLPEYRKAREGIAMLESCMTPELITEITLQPVRRYDVDAAIFFSDIVLPLKAVGVDPCRPWPTSRRSRTSLRSTSPSSPRP